MIDVIAELAPVGTLFTAGKYRDALNLLAELWEKIPIPKEQLQNSYLIVAYGAVLAQKEADLDLAWEWAKRGLVYSGNVNLGGESEFLAGEVAYARADFDQAKHYFLIARQNSGVRLSRDKNRNYWELIQ